MGICIGMGNYLLKHFLSEKEPKEFKLAVHTSGELDQNGSRHVSEGQNLGEYS